MQASEAQARATQAQLQEAHTRELEAHGREVALLDALRNLGAATSR